MAVLVIILATTSLGMAMTGTMAQGEERETDWTMNLFGSDPFIPVTGITGLPTTATPGVPLTLSGTVQPSNATNTDIVWSILNAGGTGATLTDNLLTVTSAGTVSLKATIFGGFEMVSAGDDHTAAIGRDGTLWTWGNNDSGELGLGIGNFGTSMYVPTKVGTDTDWAYVSAGGMYGYGYTMAIKTDGTLWGWGYNDYGQLGDGGTATKYLPTQIGSDTDWKTVSTGLFHTAAIKTDGTLWTWGYNASGQLGHGNMNEQEESPVQVGWDTDWEVVSAGGDHTVAIKGGDLWGWGYNSVGQLGDDPLMLHIAYARVLIDDNNTWIHVSAGNQHTVAVNDEGDLYTCGSNGSGQLGIGYGPHQSIMLEKVSLSGSVVNVSAGMFHTSVVLANGTLYSFGGNFNGELGIGSSGPNQWEPVQEYHGNSDWEYVSVGSSYTMAVKNDGTMWAWGNNLYGQLGDGTSSGKNVPTTVGAHFEVPFNITAGASGVPDYRYVITAGTSNTFTATGYNTDNSPYTVATNVAMQSAINAIQLDADGNDCSIFFANALNTVTTPYTGTGQLDIGSQNITFDDTSNAWGEITIDGKLISNLTSVALTGIIRMEGSVTINSFADITLISTPYDPNTNVIFHGSSGDLNIKGGELISDTYVIHTHVSATGNLNISGGLVKSISPFIPPPAPDSTDPAQPVAVLHESSGDLTISGSGKVQADDTVGIRRGISAGSIIISDGGTVSGYQAITFGTTTSSTQTLEILSGGKVESTYVAIYTSTGTVNVYDGAEIRAVGSGSVGIWNQNTAT
ncbi:MAG: hypothetical protein FWF18_04655, partial [Dehalococcoidia bacterium]|nr:hypothetical protein [Dehalococcoidia bacterium]